MSLHQLLERQAVDLVLTENLRSVFREQGVQSAAFNLGAQAAGLQGGHTLPSMLGFRHELVPSEESLCHQLTP